MCGELAARRRSAQRQFRFIPACAGNSKLGDLPCADVAVHPRVCGELCARQHHRRAADGSSPRVRGTRAEPVLQAVSCRFIPACAGNSDFANAGKQVAAVHPRVCGELFRERPAVEMFDGSSPRVRGTHRLCGRWRCGGRFIPACAGNSRQSRQPPSSAPVHPRVCGELLPRGHAYAERHRFIPACAGNSAWLTSPRTLPPVHPRVCGELHCKPPRSAHPRGSSPRVRGTLLLRRRENDGLAVHPRVCGELSRPLGTTMPRSHGSSPRVRGTREFHARVPVERRFIPACAGNSTASAAASASAPVHPRVCGELNIDAYPFEEGDGSSPRVRGTRPQAAMGRCCRRFIPACAGNSKIECDEYGDVTGSSPRVRGTPNSRTARRSSNRFIPACAGNSVRAT